MAEKHPDVDSYIASFEPPVSDVLTKMRRVLHDAVPLAGERISYNVAALTINGSAFLWFAGWTKHVSLYPVPDTDPAMAAELDAYRSGRGTLKFPLSRPVPYDLVARVGAALAAQR